MRAWLVMVEVEAVSVEILDGELFLTPKASLHVTSRILWDKSPRDVVSEPGAVATDHPFKFRV